MPKGRVVVKYEKNRVMEIRRANSWRTVLKGTPEREVHYGRCTEAFCKADSENLARRTEKGVQKKKTLGPKP